MPTSTSRRASVQSAATVAALLPDTRMTGLPLGPEDAPAAQNTQRLAGLFRVGRSDVGRVRSVNVEATWNWFSVLGDRPRNLVAHDRVRRRLHDAGKIDPEEPRKKGADNEKWKDELPVDTVAHPLPADPRCAANAAKRPTVRCRSKCRASMSNCSSR